MKYQNLLMNCDHATMGASRQGSVHRLRCASTALTQSLAILKYSDDLFVPLQDSKESDGHHHMLLS